MSISYHEGVQGLTAAQVRRLRSEWPNPPSPATALQSFTRMATIFAIDDGGDAIGYACGMTDGVLILYVGDVEVVPEHRGRGIEQELVRRFVTRHGQVYQVNAHPTRERTDGFAAVGFAACADDAVRMTLMRRGWQDGGPNAVE